MSDGLSKSIDNSAPGRNAPVLSFLETRRSVAMTMMSEPGPSPDQLEHMLTIAARVPDHGMLAPWRFIVFEDRARYDVSELIGDVFDAENQSIEQKQRETQSKLFSRILTHAPLVIAVVSRTNPAAKIPVWEQHLSAGAVCMNLVHAAHAHGFVANWLTGWPSYSPGVQRLMGVENDEAIAGLIFIGSSNETPTDRKRPDISSLTTRWLASAG
jgi:nitroreductase